MRLSGKTLQRRGVKGTGPDGGVKKTDFLAVVTEGVFGIVEYVLGEGRRGRKLAEAVSLGLCLLAVELALQDEALLFKGDRSCDACSDSKKG